ncbi:hypothetical protein MKX03_022246, partial [Papaver bracteatum]
NELDTKIERSRKGRTWKTRCVELKRIILINGLIFLPWRLMLISCAGLFQELGLLHTSH